MFISNFLRTAFSSSSVHSPCTCASISLIFSQSAELQSFDIPWQADSILLGATVGSSTRGTGCICIPVTRLGVTGRY